MVVQDSDVDIKQAVLGVRNSAEARARLSCHKIDGSALRRSGRSSLSDGGQYNLQCRQGLGSNVDWDGGDGRGYNGWENSLSRRRSLSPRNLRTQ